MRHTRLVFPVGIWGPCEWAITVPQSQSAEPGHADLITEQSTERDFSKRREMIWGIDRQIQEDFPDQFYLYAKGDMLVAVMASAASIPLCALTAYDSGISSAVALRIFRRSRTECGSASVHPRLSC